MAWLSARPKRRATKGRADPAPEKTRLQLLQDKGRDPDLPDPGPAAYLLDHLFDAGPTLSGGMGPAPLDWPAMQAWQASTGITLRPWELRLLRALSGAYLSQMREAEEPACPAPYSVAVITPERRSDVSTRLASLFGAMTAKKGL